MLSEKITVKKSAISLTALCVSLMLAGCEQSAEIVNLTRPSFKIDGHSIYLRGEMNDYAVMSSYQLVQFDDDLYCTLAPLRADWAPYRFKFADAQWSEGRSFGFAEPPGFLREGSAPVKLNRFSRFEDLRYYPAKDGVYRFCVEQDDDEYYVSVTEASSEELGFIDSIFLGSKEREQKKAAQ